MATIRSDDGHVLLSYRSFASVTGIVAALVSGIVLVAGIAAVLLLYAEGSPARAAAALILTSAFAFLIGLLVPCVDVTLYDDGEPVLTLSQRSAFPVVSFAVALPDGSLVAELRKGLATRLGRNRWAILQNGRMTAEAAEQSLIAAIVRKLFGKFSRAFETNVRIESGGIETGRIVRRRGESIGVDVLEITNDAVDRRVAVALATLILGLEP